MLPLWGCSWRTDTRSPFHSRTPRTWDCTVNVQAPSPLSAAPKKKLLPPCRNWRLLSVPCILTHRWLVQELPQRSLPTQPSGPNGWRMWKEWPIASSLCVNFYVPTWLRKVHPETGHILPIKSVCSASLEWLLPRYVLNYCQYLLVWFFIKFSHISGGEVDQGI